MNYKTINVKPATYNRLTIYKLAGMSFDDVLNKMMALVPEENFYECVLEEHRKRMNKIKAGEFAQSEDLDAALDEV